MWIERNSCFYVQNAFDFRYAKIKRAFFICAIVTYREIEKNLGKYGMIYCIYTKSMLLFIITNI